MLQKRHSNKHSGTHSTSTSKKLLILTLFVICICICIYTSKTNIREISINIPFLTKANPDVQEQLITEEQILTHQVKPEEPRYFSMPSLNITKSRIMGVGFENGTNKIGTTPNIHDVAWFNLSGLQNQTEKVIVLNGHNGGPNIDGIFKNLPNAKGGETFQIERGDGLITKYRIVENYTKTTEDIDGDAMERILTPIDGKETVVIISCTGKWIQKEKTYDKRVIVRGVRE